MTIDIMIFKIGVAVSVGLAFVTNLILYIALRTQKVEVDFMRSIRPGYLENLYRQTPAIRSFLLSVVAFFCTLSKYLVIIVVILLVAARALQK